MKSIVIIFVTVLALMIVCSLYVHLRYECVESHSEVYYDTTGTALAISTKNYGMMALNGFKTKEVCDSWKTKD